MTISKELLKELEAMASQDENFAKPWTKAEIEVIELYGSKVTNRTLAAMVNIAGKNKRTLASVERQKYRRHA